MKMEEIGSRQFPDCISGENSFIAVRVVDQAIGLVVSQETNGDVEVFLNTLECKRLIGWLEQALLRTKGTETNG